MCVCVTFVLESFIMGSLPNETQDMEENGTSFSTTECLDPLDPTKNCKLSKKILGSTPYIPIPKNLCSDKRSAQMHKPTQRCERTPISVEGTEPPRKALQTTQPSYSTPLDREPNQRSEDPHERETATKTKGGRITRMNATQPPKLHHDHEHGTTITWNSIISKNVIGPDASPMKIVGNPSATW